VHQYRLGKLAEAMKEGPIIMEIRKVRKQHAGRFNYGFDAIVRDLKSCERKDHGTLVSLPPKIHQPVKKQVA